MPNFCGYCGSSNAGGKFCTSCGRPINDSPEALGASPAESPQVSETLAPPTVPPPPSPPPVAEPTATPVPTTPAPLPPAPPPPAQPQGETPFVPQAAPLAGQPAVAYLPPQAPRVNPFVGWPISDYVRDTVAAFCLFATLGMPWHFELEDKGGQQWWVVISVLLSVGSLAVAYAAKARMAPGWYPTHFRLLKLALNVPLLASVVAAVVNELINIGEPFEGGLGIGIAMALAGCTLALQPRQADEEPDHSDDRMWNAVSQTLAIAAPVVGILAFAAFVIDDVTEDSRLFDEVLGFVAWALVTLVMMLVVVGWPALGYIGGSSAWRRVFATSTFTVVAIGLLALASDGDGLFTWPAFERWKGAAGIGGTLLVGAAAGLSVTRAQQRRTDARVALLDGWLLTAVSALRISAAGAGVAALALLVGVINAEEVEAAAIVSLLTVAVAAVASAIASNLVGHDGRHRANVLGLIGGVLLAGFIAIGVVNGEEVGLGPISLPEGGFMAMFPVTGWFVAALLCLPVLAAYSLTVPREVRRAFGPLVQPKQSGQPMAYPGGDPQQQPPPYPQQQYPGQQPGGPPPPSGS